MPHRILIADDNADNILLLKRILRRSGLDCEYLEAQTGREALSMMREKKPELVLLDMKMPDMDGYEAVAALRSGESSEHIPVVAVTAQAMLGDRERALAAGCDEYMTKPVDPRLLVETLKKYITGGAAGE